MKSDNHNLISHKNQLHILSIQAHSKEHTKLNICFYENLNDKQNNWICSKYSNEYQLKSQQSYNNHNTPMPCASTGFMHQKLSKVPPFQSFPTHDHEKHLDYTLKFLKREGEEVFEEKSNSITSELAEKREHFLLGRIFIIIFFKKFITELFIISEDNFFIQN